MLRKRKKLNYYPETPDDYFKLIYFDALDTIINEIEDRFEQPAFKKFMNVEELFLKAINKTDASKELKVLELDFHEDFNRNQIESEFQLIPTI